MKKTLKFLLLAMSSLLALKGFCDWGESYSTSYHINSNQIILNISTTHDHQAMCKLQAHALKLTTPDKTTNRPGTIDIQIKANCELPCQQAIGPYQGQIIFERGAALPKLPAGSYEMIINGNKQEQLLIVPPIRGTEIGNG